MSKPFKGKINVDIRDSVPDWSPLEPPKAPEGAPSVIYVVLDDTDQPDRHTRDPHRPERRAVPGAGRHAAVGLAAGRGASTRSAKPSP
jgi:hypothetical protein